MKRYEKHGFTLVELLVVIVIIGMLMGMLVPAISGARARARQLECTNNQKELGTAVTQYQTKKRHFPGFNNLIGNASGTQIIGSWPIVLLPNFGRNDLMRAWRTGQGFNSANEVWIDLLVCPSDEVTGDQPLSYVGNCGYVQQSSLSATPPDSFAPAYTVFDPANPSTNFDMVVRQIPRTGVFADRRVSTGRQPEVTIEDIRDGAAQTLLLSERANDGQTPQGTDPGHRRQYPYFVSPPLPAGQGETKAFNKANLGFVWTEQDTSGNRIRDRLYHISSNHPGVINATFCDGHVKSLNEDIDAYVYQQLMTPCGQGLRISGSTDYNQTPLDEGALDF